MQTTLLDITSTGISLKMLGLSLNLTSIPDIRLPFMASYMVLFQSNRSGQQPGESGCPCRQFFGHQYVQYSASMAADYTNPPDIFKTLRFVSCYNEAVNRSQAAGTSRTANAPISTTPQPAWILQCSRIRTRLASIHRWRE